MLSSEELLSVAPLFATPFCFPLSLLKADPLSLLRLTEKPKDIGIPNSFPYKAEVLAEIAAQRQLVRARLPSLHSLPLLLANSFSSSVQNEEEKIRLKEERRASYKAASLPEPALEEDDEIDPLGVNTLVGTRVKSKAFKAAPVEDDENSDTEMEADVEDDDEEVSGAPLLFDSELPTLQAALEKADVLLEVVDARDPLGFRSPWLEELFCGEDEEGQKGKVVIVLTKIGSSHSSFSPVATKVDPLVVLFVQISSLERLSSSGSSSSDPVSSPSSSSRVFPLPTTLDLPPRRSRTLPSSLFLLARPRKQRRRTGG